MDARCLDNWYVGDPMQLLIGRNGTFISEPLSGRAKRSSFSCSSTLCIFGTP